MQRYLPQAQIICTHPMFGPDSTQADLKGVRVALCPLSARDEITQEIPTLWTEIGVEVICISAEAHDKDAAHSQAFTYMICSHINPL
jgi:prephenate dehydrogenase